jgi:hypothetical protein
MAFHDLIALFQPGLKHTVEEQERKRNEVALPGDAAGGWDVDLEAGTATLPAATDGAADLDDEPKAPSEATDSR